MITTLLKPYPPYKPSGIDWLGDVPAHWEVRKLSQIGSLSKSNGGSREGNRRTHPRRRISEKFDKIG